MKKVLYTVPEVVTLLGLSRSKVYELMGTGYLSYVLVGRSRRITSQALDAFVQSAIEGHLAP